MSGEERAGLTIALMLVDTMANTQPMDCVISVGINPERMQAGKEFVDCQTGEKHVQLYDSGPILLHAMDVALADLRAVILRVSAIKAGSAHLVHGVDMPAEEARSARPKIMDCAADLIDTTEAISFELHAKVEVRNQVKGSQLVEQMPTVNRIHATKDNVAAGNRMDSIGIE